MRKMCARAKRRRLKPVATFIRPLPLSGGAILIALLLILLSVLPARASIAYVNSWSTNTTGTGTALSISTGSGTQAAAGNVLVACINFYNAGISMTCPSGWSTAVAQFDNSLIHMLVCDKVATSGDVGATFTFTPSGAAYLSGGITCLSGEYQSQPIDVAGLGSTGTSGAVTAASITTTVANDYLLWCGQSSLAGTVAQPTGYTAGWGIATSGAVEGSTGGYNGPVSTGATGNVASTTTSTQWEAVLVALAPSAPSGNVQHGFFWGP